MEVMSLLAHAGFFPAVLAATPALGWREVGIAGAGCAVLLSFAFLVKRVKKPAAHSVPKQSPAHISEVVRDVEAVIGELEKLSRRMHQRLDQKIAQIEALLQTADERMDGLSRAQRQVRGQATVDVTVDDNPLGGVASTKNFSGEHEEVYRLADAGVDALQIGRRVGRPVGEIELILSLRRTAQAAGR